MLAVVYLDITDKRRPTPRFISEGKRRDGIKCRENIALPRHQRSAEGWIEVVFCRQGPGEKLLGRAVTCLADESLGDAVFDFSGVFSCVVVIKANNSAELLNAGYTVIDNFRLDHVLPLVFTSIPDAF